MYQSSESCCGSSHDHNHHSHVHNHSHDHEHDHENAVEDFNPRKEVMSVVLISILFIVGFTFENQLHNTFYSIAEYIVFITAYLFAGWNVLMSTEKNIVRLRFFDENCLMNIATLGALAIHKLPEAVAVMLFFKIGELFQDLAVSCSRKSIKFL